MGKALLFLAVLVVTPYFCHALSCFCGYSPCEKPGCCESGSYSGDVCGCCTTCAKAEGAPCGGPWGVTGACAEGLSCFKQCTCQTINRKPCVFPFKYKGKVYEGCTKENSENEQPWCATAVDPQTGEVLSGFWEDCASGCPGSDYPCGLFNLDGVCVNAEFRANIEAEADIHIDPVSNEPNFEFFDGVKDYKGDGSVSAPICSAVKTTIEGNGPIDANENVVGECKCAEECNLVLSGHSSDDDFGWCFLGSIRDPQEPTKHCYQDTIWSPTAGRFWSRDACKAEASAFPEPPPPPPFAASPPKESTPDYDIPVVNLDDEVVEDVPTSKEPTTEPIHFSEPVETVEEEQAE